MRSLFNGLGSGRGAARTVLKDLLKDLQGGEIRESVWNRVLSTSGLEDAAGEELHRERLWPIIEQHRENGVGLTLKCVHVLEDVLALEAELGDKEELMITNVALVLQHLLVAGPSPTASTVIPEGSEAAASVQSRNRFTDRLWEEPEPGSSSSGRPLAARIADAALGLLFFEGFGIDHIERKDDQELVNGVDPLRLWCEGLGPTGTAQAKPATEPRQQMLELLAALLCGGAPAAVQRDLEEAETEAAAAPSGGDAAAAAAPPAARPLMADHRALAYLTDPERHVPFRGELMYSLLSAVLGYDPHGYGLPYASYLGSSKDEDFVCLCLQVVVLLLQDARDADIPMAATIVERRPQEIPFQNQMWPLPTTGPHFFREMLVGIATDREVAFMVSGVTTVLGTISEERSTFLPSSMRLPVFLVELGVLIFHLSGCPAFVKGLCSDGELPGLVEGMLHLALKEELAAVPREQLALVVGAVLMRLTAYRGVCLALNEDFDGELPETLQNFRGSSADLVAMAALKQASENILAAKASEVHRLIVEVNLSVLCNISPYTENFCTETSFRLLALIERCAKTAQARRGRTSFAWWLPKLLEVILNVLQYQYPSNANLVYGLATRKALFADLQALVSSKASGEDGDENDSAEAPVAWWEDLEVLLVPIVGLLDIIVPLLETQVEKKDVSTPEQAKSMLPRSVIGLLPVPHAFASRTLFYGGLVHPACEACLAHCVATGPLAFLWEVANTPGGPVGLEAEKARGSEANGDAARRRSSSRRAREAGARDRSSSRAAAGPRDRGSSPPRRPPPKPPAEMSKEEVAAALRATVQAAAAQGLDIAALLQQLGPEVPAAAAAARSVAS